MTDKELLVFVPPVGDFVAVYFYTDSTFSLEYPYSDETEKFDRGTWEIAADVGVYVTYDDDTSQVTWKKEEDESYEYILRALADREIDNILKSETKKQ